MATLPTIPKPPDATVVRFVDGRPTTAQITYEQRVYAWMQAVAAYVAGQ